MATKFFPGLTAKETVARRYESDIQNINGEWVPNPGYLPDFEEFAVKFLHGDHDNDNYPLEKPIFSKFKKDISKVHFDFENVEGMGIHTLSNGLTYYAFTAGGDWEQPIYIILYWDGKSFRGYIPTEGNPWNTATNCAYGNDGEKVELDEPPTCCSTNPYCSNKATWVTSYLGDLYFCDEHIEANKVPQNRQRKLTEKEMQPDPKSDEANCLKRFGVSAESYNKGFDIDKIQADILERIIQK